MCMFIPYDLFSRFAAISVTDKLQISPMNRYLRYITSLCYINVIFNSFRTRNTVAMLILFFL